MKTVMILSIFALFLCATAEEQEQAQADVYSRAVIESCPGCSLNRLVEVKRFIYDDLQKYHNVEFKKIHGAKPELVLYDANDAEVSRIKLEQLTRQQCNDLLVSKGFQLKENTKNNEL